MKSLLLEFIVVCILLYVCRKAKNNLKNLVTDAKGDISFSILRMHIVISEPVEMWL